MTQFFMITATIAVFAGLAAGVEIPEVQFPGIGIGAKFADVRQPVATWSTEHGRANVSDRCYLRGQKIELTVAIINPSENALMLAGRWRWVWIGDAEADAKGGVRYVGLAEHSTQPLASVEIAPAKSHEVTFAFEAPQRTGILGLFLEAGGVTRWVTNVAVLNPVAPGQRPDSMFFGDLRGVREWQRARELPTHAKLGVKWVRVGEDWGRIEPKQGEYRWDSLDREVARVRDADMLAIYLGGNGANWTRAFGKLAWPRNNPNKASDSPDPSNYGHWSAFYEQVAKRYADTVKAINVFNEPWEAGGISNWGGTGAHYRDLQRMAHLGAKRGNPDVLIGGNDSDNNIVDNLMSDPSWRNYTDLLTVHGGEFPSQYIHRKSPEGMAIWNTEHWYTAQTDRTVQEQLFNLIAGRSKTNLVILGNFFTAGYQSGGYYNPKDEATAPDLIPQPNAAGYNAMSHFLEGMRLVEELSPDRLPYAMLFERVAPTTDAAQHKAVLVLIGTSIEPGKQVWWQMHAAPSATLHFAKPPGITGVFDRYANPILPQADGTTAIPFNTQAVYLTADSTDALRAIVDQLQPRGLDHVVQIGVLDPIDDKLVVRLTNPLPQDIEANVSVLLGDDATPAEAKGRVVKIARGQFADLSYPLTASIPAAGLLVKVNVDAGQVGRAEWTEMVQSRIVARFTPTVDGDVADWLAHEVPLLLVRPGGSEQGQAIAAAMPWEAAANQQGNDAMGRWALAYDDTSLYVVAQLRIPERGNLPWDQRREDWYELHPGGYAYKAAPRWPFAGESLQLALDLIDNPDDAIYPDDDPRRRRYPQFATDYLVGFYETAQGESQAWLYRRPGGPFRHRYPFSVMKAIDQQVPLGVKVVVKRDEASSTTTFEAAIPLALMPEMTASSGRILRGADVKITTHNWSGIFSAAGRGAAKADQSVFQPYWMPGYTTELPWRFGQ